MSKRIEQDGKFYRIRKGKLVQIPERWVSVVTYKQTKKKRPSYKQNLKKKSGR